MRLRHWFICFVAGTSIGMTWVALTTLLNNSEFLAGILVTSIGIVAFNFICFRYFNSLHLPVLLLVYLAGWVFGFILNEYLNSVLVFKDNPGILLIIVGLTAVGWFIWVAWLEHKHYTSSNSASS